MLEFEESLWDWTPESKLVILTGAGVSAESGIKTFRDAGGLWEGYRVEEVATPEGFAANPKLVIDFYNARRAQLKEVTPNPGHEAIAQCSKRLQERFHLITQNVDDLHQRADTLNVLPMHGELKTLRCVEHGHLLETSEQQTYDQTCSICHSLMRPNIVWFGEMPFYMDEIHKLISNCTHFIYCGTSSLVYPAAGFKQWAKMAGAKVLCLNLEVPNFDPDTDLFLEGKAGTLLPSVLDSLS